MPIGKIRAIEANLCKMIMFPTFPLKEGWLCEYGNIMRLGDILTLHNMYSAIYVKESIL